MSALENVNNAIVRLDFIARGTVMDARRKKAITDLAQHWQRHVWSRNGRNVAPARLKPILDAYVRWYARAYYLLPSELRTQVVAPERIDVSFGQVVDDEVRRIAEVVADGARVANGAMEAAGRTVDSLADMSARAASAIAQSADNLLSRVERDVFVLLGFAVMGLYFWTRR